MRSSTIFNKPGNINAKNALMNLEKSSNAAVFQMQSKQFKKVQGVKRIPVQSKLGINKVCIY